MKDDINYHIKTPRHSGCQELSTDAYAIMANFVVKGKCLRNDGCMTSHVIFLTSHVKLALLESANRTKKLMKI